MLDLLNHGLSFLLSNFFSRLLLAIFSGLLLALSLAGYGLSFVVWFALVFLFLLIKSSKGLLGALLDSFIFFMAFNLASFIWVLSIHPLTWQGLSNFESITVSLLGWLSPSIAHSLVMLVFCTLLKLFFSIRANDRSCELNFLDIVFLSFIWVVLVYKVILTSNDSLRTFFVPINLLAYSQYQNLYLIQISKVVGSLGVEFFILIVNLLLSNLFNVHKVYNKEKTYSNNLNIRKKYFGIEGSSSHVNILGLIVVLGSIFYYYGYQSIKTYRDFRTSAPAQKIAILQADYSVKSTRSPHGLDKLTQLQSKLSQSINTPVDFLFWAEGSIPRDNFDGLSLAKSLETKTKNFAYGTFITENGQSFNALQSISFAQELSPQSILINQDSQVDLEQEETNTLLIKQVSKAQSSIKQDNYKKNLLVQFGEYTPLYNQLPETLKELASNSIGSGFSSSNIIKNISTNKGNYAPSICFEILFPEYIRKFINKDTDFMVNLNDLSWFKNPISFLGIKLKFLEGFVQRMMLSAATFRAIENNRDLVLVSNAGISTVIHADGSRDKESKVNSIELIEDDVYSNRKLSIYTQYGF